MYRFLCVYDGPIEREQPILSEDPTVADLVRSASFILPGGEEKLEIGGDYTVVAKGRVLPPARGGYPRLVLEMEARIEEVVVARSPREALRQFLCNGSLPEQIDVARVRVTQLAPAERRLQEVAA